jgi:hypothetical protein
MRRACQACLVRSDGRSREHELQSWVDRLALEREHSKDTFVHTSERLAGDEAFQRLVAEGEFTKREIALAAEFALAQPDDVLGRVILRTIDDAQIFLAAHL